MISDAHMYAQFIDDERGVTLAAASTLGTNGANNLARARSFGRKAAGCALSKGIRNMVVDRGGYKFHGRLKAIVDSVIEAGVGAGKTATGVTEASSDVEGGEMGSATMTTTERFSGQEEKSQDK